MLTINAFVSITQNNFIAILTNNSFVGIIDYVLVASENYIAFKCAKSPVFFTPGIWNINIQRDFCRILGKYAGL